MPVTAARPVRLARLVLLAVLMGGAFGPLPAFARDICLHDTAGADWSFQKVKKLKPGRVVSLAGVFIRGGESFPVSGSAVLHANGVVELGAFVHAMSGNIFMDSNFTVSMQLSTGLEGTGSFDADGDFQNDPGIYGWAAVDCKTLTIP